MYLELQVSVESFGIEYYVRLKNKLVKLHSEYDKLIAEILQRFSFEKSENRN